MSDLGAGAAARLRDLDDRAGVKAERQTVTLLGRHLHDVTDQPAQRVARAFCRKTRSAGWRDNNRIGQAAQDGAVEVQLDVVAHEADRAQLRSGEIMQLADLRHRAHRRGVSPRSARPVGPTSSSTAAAGSAAGARKPPPSKRPIHDGPSAGVIRSSSASSDRAIPARAPRTSARAHGQDARRAPRHRSRRPRRSGARVLNGAPSHQIPVGYSSSTGLSNSSIRRATSAGGSPSVSSMRIPRRRRPRARRRRGARRVPSADSRHRSVRWPRPGLDTRRSRPRRNESGISSSTSCSPARGRAQPARPRSRPRRDC